MKKISAIKFLLLIGVLLTSLATSGQENFTEFLKLFPEVTWEQMDSIVQLPWTQHDFRDSVPIHLANRNMWYDFEQRDKYNHRSEKMKCEGYSYSISAPWMKFNGKIHSYGGVGIFYSHHSVYDDIKHTYRFYVSPICKYYISKDYVLLLILYKYCNRERLPSSQYCFSIDAYTYRISDEQLISALGDIYSYPFDATLSKRNVVFNADKTITSYSYSYDWEVGEESAEITRDKYSLDTEGFFVYHGCEGRDAYMAEIVDLDGYVNVRSEPNSSSSILMKLDSGTKVLVDVNEGSNWVVLRKYDTKNGICRYRSGYIHKSRVKLGEQLKIVYTRELESYGGEYGFLRK